MTPAPLWRCPRCGRTFAARDQTHTCAPLDASVRAAFDRVVEVVSALGPVEVLPERSRIALHVRMSFAAFTPRRHWLNGHVVLDQVVESPRFTRVEVFSPHNVLHAFRLDGPGDVDAEVAGWLAAAYRVGEQRHRQPKGQ